MNSSPTTMTDVMVDLETTGTRPDRAGILQIGAVRFNLEHMTIDADDMFNRCLDLPPWRQWEEGTREWWYQQDPEVFQDILNRAEPHKQVMDDFFRWSCKWPNLRFWAKPTSFDFTFVSSYFHDHGYANPFHFRVARDVNTWVEARHYPNPVPDVPRSDFGPAHNALNDALMQVEYVFRHYEATK